MAASSLLRFRQSRYNTITYKDRAGLKATATTTTAGVPGLGSTRGTSHAGTGWGGAGGTCGTHARNRDVEAEGLPGSAGAEKWDRQAENAALKAAALH